MYSEKVHLRKAKRVYSHIVTLMMVIISGLFNSRHLCVFIRKLPEKCLPIKTLSSQWFMTTQL
jgi:hypothetical protein